MSEKRNSDSEISQHAPVDEIRDGKIRSAIFEHEGKYGPRYNATIERRWLDDEGNWRSSNSFSESEALRAAKVLDKAHGRMLGLRDEHTQSRSAVHQRNTTDTPEDNPTARLRSRGRARREAPRER